METRKSYERRVREGFFAKYIVGRGIDIGCGRVDSHGGADPISSDYCFHHDKDVCDALWMDFFQDEEFDYVYSSHCLEHIEDPITAIKNWYRILKFQGFLIITVPSLFRYEKQLTIPPSRYNEDHKEGYTIGTLMTKVERALIPNSYLVEYVKDCAEGYDWTISPEKHAGGEYQIELVLRKIPEPFWKLK